MDPTITSKWRLQLFCGHCDIYVNEKTYKEHRKLYCIDGKWLKSGHLQSDSSRSSSPLDLDYSSLDTQSLDDIDIANESNGDYEDDTGELIVDVGKIISTI